MILTTTGTRENVSIVLTTVCRDVSQMEHVVH